MPKVFVGYVILSMMVLVTACGQSYRVAVLFGEEAEAAEPPALGKSEIVDALKRMRKNARTADDARVPQWVLRTMPKPLCATASDENMRLNKKEKKKIERMVRRLSSNVRVVLDYTCEAALDVLLPLYEQYNLIAVSPYARTPRAVNMLSTGIGLDIEFHTMAHFLRTQGVKHVAIVDDGLRYSRYASNVLISTMNDFDISYATATGFMLPDGQGVTELVRRIVKEKNAEFVNDAIVYLGVSTGAAAFVKKAREARFLKPIFLHRLMDEAQFVSKLHTYTDNLYIVGKESSTGKASWNAFLAWFESHYAGLSPTRAVTEAYVALEVALNLAHRAKADTPSKDIEIDLRLKEIRIPTLLGDVYFDEQNTIRGVYHMYAIQDNSFVRYPK